MKLKNIKQKILFIIMFALILNIINFTTYATEKNFEITTNFGIDGKVKSTASTPIEIDIKNISGSDFVGDIEILVPNLTGNLDSYQQEIQLKKDENKKVFMPLNQLTMNKKVKIRFKQNSDIVFEQEVAVNAKEIEQQQILIGMLTDDPKNLSYLEGLNVSTENYYIDNSFLVNITPELLESNYKNFQSLDIILINNYDTSKLSQQALNQLDVWVNNGGILLIGGSEKTLNKLSNDFVNVDISPTKNTWFNLKEGGLSLPCGTLSGDYGKVLVGDSSKFLASAQKRGTGDIVITTFDLATKNFYEFGSVQSLLARMLNYQFSRKFSWEQTGLGYPYDLQQILESLEVSDKVDVSKVIIVLVVFIVIISFGGYFLFKVINKRNFLWVFIPVVSIIFTFIMASLGSEISVKDKILNSVNVINVDKNGNGKMNTFMSIGNKYASNLVIQEPEGTRVQYIYPDNYRPLPIGNTKDVVDVETIYDGEKTYYDFNKVSALDLKTFRITGKEGTYKPIQANLNYLEDGITGAITNPYYTDIESLIVVFENNIWDIGKLEKGATFTFENNQPTYLGSLYDYCDSFTQSYYDEMWEGTLNENIDKYKGKMRNYEVVNFASQFAEAGAYCIAITNDEVKYGFTFEDEDISKFSKTAYVSTLEINFKDSEGNTIFPLGYIKGEVESIDDTLGYDSYRGRLWGTGEAIINFTFEEKFVLSSVTFKCPPLINDGRGSQPFKGSIKLYNFKTEKYEDVKFSVDTPYQMTKFTNYLKEGQIKIKVIGKDEEDSQIPMISVKGRYKK